MDVKMRDIPAKEENPRTFLVLTFGLPGAFISVFANLWPYTVQ